MPDPTRQTVSASQVPALFDRSPYFTRWALWHHFRGDIDLDEGRRANNRMEWGVNLQTPILDATARRLRLDVSENTRGEYRRAGPVGATIDGLTNALDVGPIIVEAKSVDWLVFKHDWQGGRIAPPHIEIQTQINIKAVEGCRRGVIAALVGGNDLKLIERDRDDEMLAQIDEAAEEFLASVREGREPPPLGDARDLPVLARLYPEADPAKVTEDFADLEMACKLRMYRAAKAEEAGQHRLKEQLEAEILAYAGDAGLLRLNGFECRITKRPIAPLVCAPHAEPLTRRRGSVRTEIAIRETATVEIEPRDPNEVMAA